MFFYSFGLLTILNLIQVAIMGSKYLGKYGIKGQLIVSIELILGFTLTQSHRRILHLIIGSPWILSQSRSAYTKKLSLCIYFIMISYWLGIKENPLNNQTDYFGMIICIIMIIIQWISKDNVDKPIDITKLYQVTKITNETENKNLNNNEIDDTDEKEKEVEKEEIICPICLDSIEDQSVITSCKHVFHEECLSMWIIDHHTCPYCRSELQ